jgi:CheY-like chemotaxis protein
MFSRTNKDITIHRKFATDLWTVEVDQIQIDQVLLNIYVNAWQAMPGGGRLFIQTANVLLDHNAVRPHGCRPGPFVKISVTDSGVGMDEKTQKRIFDPFFTTREKERGTGLGLASAYGIVKNHDGIITVDSQKDQGTTFNIFLPASDKTVAKPAGSAPEPELPRGSETVLLVDDEDYVRDVGRQILERLGYTVVTAAEGDGAVRRYEKDPGRFDLVILDLKMPGLDGGAVFDRLRQIDPQVKVILSSGYSITGQAMEIIRRGCNGFIQKPFSMNRLSQKIRELLD